MRWSAVRSSLATLLTRFAFPLHGALVMVTAVAVYLSWVPAISDMKLVSPAQENVTLPYTVHHGKNVYVFEGTLTETFTTADFLTIQADDCIKDISVDNTQTFSTSCMPCEHCQYSRFPLPALTSGKHRIKVTLKDYGMVGVLDIRQSEGMGLVHALFMVLAGWTLLLLLRWQGQNLALVWLGMLAMVLTSYYHLATGVDVRQHDVNGHREYIDVLLRSWTLPQVKQGWETWQPPGYYALATAWVKATAFLDVPDPFRRVQVLSSILYVLVVFLGIVFWRRFNFPRHTGWVGLALLVMMPAHVFMSGRINNDVMMPLFGTVLTLLGWSYAQHGRWRTVLATGLTLLLAMITKTSSLSLVAGAGLTLLWKDHLDRRPVLSRLGRSALLGMPAALWLAYWFNRNKEQTGEYIYVNAELSDALKVANNAYKYFSFDWQDYLAEGSFNTFGGHIRDSFPTSLATSLLSGEYTLEWLGLLILTFVRIAFLPMLLLFGLAMFSRPPSWRVRPWMPALLMFTAHLFFMANYNNKYSYACNQDARLWAPVYFPAAVLWSWGYESALERFKGHVRTFFLLAPYVFLGLLGIFYRKMFFP